MCSRDDKGASLFFFRFLTPLALTRIEHAAGIVFSADLTLRWWADGFWDFFHGVDAGPLSSSTTGSIKLCSFVFSWLLLSLAVDQVSVDTTTSVNWRQLHQVKCSNRGGIYLIFSLLPSPSSM